MTAISGLFGSDLEPEDVPRLSSHAARIRDFMLGRGWVTVDAVVAATGPGDVTRLMRYLRAPKFGGHTLEKRRVAGGLWEYRLLESGKEKRC